MLKFEKKGIQLFFNLSHIFWQKNQSILVWEIYLHSKHLWGFRSICPSMHSFFICFSFFGSWGAGAAVIVWGVGYTLDKTWVHQRVKYRQTAILSCRNNLELPIWLFLLCERKPTYVKGGHPLSLQKVWEANLQPCRCEAKSTNYCSTQLPWTVLLKGTNNYYFLFDRF